MGHGVTVSEVATGAKPPVRSTAGLAVYVGTAPINLGDETAVNKALLFNTLAEAQAKLGPLGAVDSADWGKWTLLEAVKAHFLVYEVGPIVCINVLDPDNDDHIGSLVDERNVLIGDEVTVADYPSASGKFGILASTVVVKVGASVKALGTDYTLAFDDDGLLVVTRVTTGTIAANAVLLVSCDFLDPDGVTADDIIGGYDAPTYTGLEVVKQVFPSLRLVPGFLCAPKWSQTPSVAARIGVLGRILNGCFRTTALVDLSSDTDEIASYGDAAAWKSDNGFDAVGMITCWGKVKNGDDVYHGSTVVACVANVTDAGRGGLPYESPSNKALIGTAMVLDDGVEVLLDQQQANQLNDQGIVTFLNTFNGWKVWGNRGGAYPGNTDVKDSTIPVRRMFDFVENTLVLTIQTNVDSPGNRRQLDIVVGTAQGFVDGLTAAGALFPAKVEFRASENPVLDVADGHYRFHLTMSPPPPMANIEFITEYDPAAIAAALT